MRITEAILTQCGIEVETPSNLVFAIDAPLGWPESAIRLLTESATSSVGRTGRHNPYLFRKTEVFLKEQGFQPKPVIGDRIGSPSTKSIHFLQATGLQRLEIGVWENRQNQRTVTAIETYPAACRSSEALKHYFSKLRNHYAFESCLTRNKRHNKDLKDALYCALVAWLFATNRECLQSPSEDIPVEEGWIWVPQDALASES